MKEAFEEYIKNYDLNNKEIKKKYDHSYRVMSLSKKYATLLDWNDHDIELATLIGLLHDIGRFEQLKIYKTYDDSKSIDHAHFGVQELFEKDYIKCFWQNKQDYDIIKFAIENHNKYEIEKTSNKQALKHAKLIRDTDKIDISYLLGFLKQSRVFSKNKIVSGKVKDDFFHHKTVNLNDIKTKNDRILCSYSHAFNVYNTICLEELKQNIITYSNYVDPNKNLDRYYQETMKYINKRLKK